VFFVDVPGAQQAVVQVMHPGPRRTAPDYETTSVLASILSSGFSSRINMNIREKHGYAYGAGGGFSYTRDAGIFSVAASVRIDTAGPSIREILKEMEAIRAADVTPDELSREKQGAILALPSRWSTGQSIVSTFQGLQYYGLPLDEYTRSVPRIQAVDAAKVLAAAKAYVHPEVAQVLVVGDAATVLPQIEALQKDGTLPAGIVRLDTDGKVLTELGK
jgi:zinc protease